MSLSTALALHLTLGCSGGLEAQDSALPGLAVGETCTTATECQEGLICPYTAPDLSERACADPMAGIYDDGTRDRFEGAGSWGRVRVDDWEALDARCNDGSSYAYYVSPGTGDDWLIFFKGGGSCQDEDSCARRWVHQNWFMRQQRTGSSTWSPGPTTGEDAGLFSRDEPTNPFADSTFVYLPYCSSDTYVGTRSGPESDAHLWFRGHANASAVVDELLAGLDTSALGLDFPSLSDAGHVVIAGGSAGAVGARHNMDWMADRIKAASPSAVVQGLDDSVVIPKVHPEQYRTENSAWDFWAPRYDADCVEAHPEDHAWVCDDQVHLINGRGKATVLGGQDDGHLGVPASSEQGAVDGHFTFMAQFDNTMASLGSYGICVPDDECAEDGDCDPGQGCAGGLCLNVEPCQPAYCTPGDEPCNGVGAAPACLAEAVSHTNICNEGDDATCGAGESCLRGFCIQAGYSGCETADDCPADFSCESRVCSTGVADSDDCDLEGYIYQPDTRSCDQLIGCSDDNPCGDGYLCLGSRFSPISQTAAWGTREELRGLGPTVGVFVPNSSTHTATISDKFYGRALPLVDGDTFAEAVDKWMTDPDTYDDHISLPDNVPLLLWSGDVLSLGADGLEERTSASGCADDAIGFILCELDGDCTLADALAGVTLGDSGTVSFDGVAPAAPVQLTMAVVTNPLCDEPTLTPEDGAWLALEHVVPTTGETRTLRVAIPGAALGTANVTLYIGADGAVYEDRALTSLVAGRRE